MADWNAIKIEYITTDTSYRRLAKKYGISDVQIATVGKREEWVKLRKQYLSKTLAQTLEKTAEMDSDRLSRLMDTTARAIDVVVGAFDDAQQFHRYLVDRRETYADPVVEEDGTTALEERQWTEEQVFRKVDTRALKDLTAVLKDLTGLMRDFYNIPTPAQAEAQRIAAARLELDSRKAEADGQTEAVEVVFDGAETEDWSG